MKKKGKKVIHRGIILFPFNLEGSCDLRSLQRLSCTKTAKPICEDDILPSDPLFSIDRPGGALLSRESQV